MIQYLCLSNLVYWTFFYHFLLFSFEKQVCTGCYGNSMCAVCSVHPPHPCVVYALPFTERHLFLWGLTGQKQEMQIILVWWWKWLLLWTSLIDNSDFFMGLLGFIRMQFWKPDRSHWIWILRRLKHTCRWKSVFSLYFFWI